jgi:hypothetical protein
VIQGASGGGNFHGGRFGGGSDTRKEGRQRDDTVSFGKGNRSDCRCTSQ